MDWRELVCYTAGEFDQTISNMQLLVNTLPSPTVASLIDPIASAPE